MQRSNPTETLLDLACRHDIVLHLARLPGDFVHEGRLLLEAQPGGRVDPAISKSCNAAFVIGGRRTALQGLRFGIDELVEIAARALSPGVNDLFTAIACIDWLGAALSEIGLLRPPRAVMAGQSGEARVILRKLEFEDYVASSSGQLRPYVARDPNARHWALATSIEVAAGVRREEYRRQVFGEIQRLRACGAMAMGGPEVAPI